MMLLTEKNTRKWTIQATNTAFISKFRKELPQYTKPFRIGNRYLSTFFEPLPVEDASYQRTRAIFSAFSPTIKNGFIPRTPLGRKLLSLRSQAIQKGMKLLSADEVLEETKLRRGELVENEKNLS